MSTLFTRTIRLGILAALVLALWGGRPLAGVAAPALLAPPQLLQFTSAGHALGFAPGAVYAAGGSHAYRVEFVGADPAAAPQDAGAAPAAADGAGRARPLAQVTYRSLWPGITLSYDALPGAVLRSTYRLEPYADPGRIRLRYNAPVQVEPGGALALAYATGVMHESTPLAWQEPGGRRLPVAAAFALHGSREVGFRLGDYDPALPLYIDPALTWNTFLGGSSSEEGTAIALDNSGNVYVAGYSADWGGAPVRAHYANTYYDAFAAKVDSSGNLVWHTFLGGKDLDEGWAISVDSSGNVYVAGQSTAAWGTGECTGCPINAFHGSGNADVFAAKLNSNGVLQWNTFQGGNSSEGAYALALDGDGNLYLAGYAYGSWWPPNAVRSYSSGYDAFAAKVSNGGALAWYTFLGGSSDDDGRGIALDGSGNVYVVGQTAGNWVEDTPVRAFGGGAYDAFAAQLNNNGALQWYTFLGGANTDESKDVVVDGSSSVFLTGYSLAGWGSGECENCPIRPYSGSGQDAFVARLNCSGALQWNTFLGGAGSGETGYGIALDSNNYVYVTGAGNGSWGTPIRPYSAGVDAFAAILQDSGALLGNTFMGGSGWDEGAAIAVDGNGYSYLAGDSNAAWGTPQEAYHAGSDVLLVKGPPLQSYADDDGLCSNYKPCFTSLQSALDNVMTTGVAWYFPGTFTMPVTLTERITVSHTGGGDVTLGSDLAIFSGTFSAPATQTLSLSGNFTYAGGTFNANNGTLAFTGSGVQYLSAALPLALNNLTVNAGVTLSDVQVTDNVTVDGLLTNNGTLYRQTAVSGAPVTSFGWDGYGGLVVDPNGQDLGLTSVQIRGNQDCTNVAGETLQRCFNISPGSVPPSGVTLTFFFAAADIPASQDCNTMDLYHWNGSWSSALARDPTYGIAGRLCAVEPYSIRVTGVTDFSPFALKSDGAPTPVRTRAFRASAAPGSPGLAGLALLAALALVIGLHSNRRGR